MHRTVTSSRLVGSVTPPPSKSVSHRALILGSLSSPGTRIRNILQSADVNATKRALELLGAEFVHEDDDIIVKTPISHGYHKVDCGNSGTSLRLLIGVVSLFEEETTLFGDESLNKRPIGKLLEVLRKIDVKTSSENLPPVKISGPASRMDISLEIDGGISSQFISSLLILCAVRGEGAISKITILPPVISRPYIDLTITLLQEFGVKISEEEINTIEIVGKDKLEPCEVHVPIDYSSAAFFIAAGCLGENAITIKVDNTRYVQADQQILNILERMGAKISQGKNSIEVKGSQLAGGSFDLRNSPDIFPILCLMASQAKGQTTFTGASHLKFKETDRIAETVRILQQFGVKINPTEDGAIVIGSQLSGDVKINPKGDHRLAMMASIAATRASTSTIIEDPQCVSVSYPTFFEDLDKLATEKEVHT